MFLTKEEERILDGEEGEASKKAMEILVALGNISDADRLIKIKSAQISGVSYKTIGDAGLEFLEEFASLGAKVKVPTTLNPAGVDLESWRSLGFPEKFVKKQMKIINAYKKMGVTLSCTCTPYLAGNAPKFGESIAWAESSSAIFANSILGARTNRESGISALAAAIIGKTPHCGLHLDENRKATFSVDVKIKMENQTDYAALGYYIGKNYEGIPVFKNIKPSLEDAKALGAALAVGSISMFRIEGKKSIPKDKVDFGREELKNTYEKLNTAQDSEVDMLCIGCPHSTVKEILEVEKLRPKKEVWIFTGRQNKKMLKNKNIKIICDTCMVVSPLEEMGIKAIGVNSAKAAFYSANLSKLKVRFDRLENLLK